MIYFTFLSARATRLLSSLPGMESRWSRAQRKARFCKGKGMSEALTRTLRRSCCSCCSIDFFFCIKLLRNLLLLSNSSSAPSISFFFHRFTLSSLGDQCFTLFNRRQQFQCSIVWEKGKKEKGKETTLCRGKRVGETGKGTKVSNAMFALVFLFFFCLVFFRCVSCCCCCVWPRSLG